MCTVDIIPFTVDRSSSSVVLKGGGDAKFFSSSLTSTIKNDGIIHGLPGCKLRGELLQPFFITADRAVARGK